MKSEIPVVVYTFFFSIGIIISIIGLIYVNTQSKYTDVTNNIISWFFILLGINFINLLITFRFYANRKQRRGKKGEKGIQGLRGLPGENIRCGTICGEQGKNNCPDDEKDKEGICIISGGSIDENGDDKSSEENIQQGRCIFPFVYNYKNQYEPLKPTSNDWDTNDTSLPSGGEKYGICATSLNENKTPKTWGYVVNSSARAREMSAANQSSNRNEKLLEKQSGILDIKIVTGDTSSEATCPEAYNRIDGDLNQGAGAYVYMCSKTGVDVEGVVNMEIAKGNQQCKDVFDENVSEENLTKLPVNLNKDTKIGNNSPDDLYLCIEKGNTNFITNIEINENENWNVNDNSHYFKVNGDLNRETGGFPVFLYASRRQIDLNPIQTAFYLQETELLYFIKEDEIIDKDKKFDREIYYGYDPSKNKVAQNIGQVLGNQIPKRSEAILALDNSRIFVFKGNLVYELIYNQNGSVLSDGYPTQIQNVFPGIPSALDAVYQDTNGSIYFFKNEDVYEFTLNYRQNNNTKVIGSLAPNSPKPIGELYVGAPSYVDAVFSLPANPKQVFFIRGHQYWVTNDFTIDGTYPKMVDDYFQGLNTLKEMVNVNRTETFTNQNSSNSKNNNNKKFKQGMSMLNNMEYPSIKIF